MWLTYPHISPFPKVAYSLSQIENNYDVALDDRKESPGIKFKDAELLGIPFQLRIGPKSLEKGVVELKDRLLGNVLELDKDDLQGIKDKLDELLR